MQPNYLPNKSKCIDNCAKIVTVEVTLATGKKVLVSCVYRAPNTNADILSDFFLDILRNNRNKTIYLCGDFNIDLLQSDKNNSISNFIDNLYSMGLHPLITRPTRILTHSLIWRPSRVADTPPLLPISRYGYCLFVADVCLCSEVLQPGSSWSSSGTGSM